MENIHRTRTKLAGQVSWTQQAPKHKPASIAIPRLCLGWVAIAGGIALADQPTVASKLVDRGSARRQKLTQIRGRTRGLLHFVTLSLCHLEGCELGDVIGGLCLAAMGHAIGGSALCDRLRARQGAEGFVTMAMTAYREPSAISPAVSRESGQRSGPL